MFLNFFSNCLRNVLQTRMPERENGLPWTISFSGPLKQK